MSFAKENLINFRPFLRPPTKQKDIMYVTSFQSKCFFKGILQHPKM